MTSSPASQSDSCVLEITLSGIPVLTWRRRRSYRYQLVPSSCRLFFISHFILSSPPIHIFFPFYPKDHPDFSRQSSSPLLFKIPFNLHPLFQTNNNSVHQHQHHFSGQSVTFYLTSTYRQAKFCFHYLIANSVFKFSTRVAVLVDSVLVMSVT